MEPGIRALTVMAQITLAEVFIISQGADNILFRSASVSGLRLEVSRSRRWQCSFQRNSASFFLPLSLLFKFNAHEFAVHTVDKYE